MSKSPTLSTKQRALLDHRVRTRSTTSAPLYKESVWALPILLVNLEYDIRRAEFVHMEWSENVEEKVKEIDQQMFSREARIDRR